MSNVPALSFKRQYPGAYMADGTAGRWQIIHHGKTWHAYCDGKSISRANALTLAEAKHRCNRLDAGFPFAGSTLAQLRTPNHA
jgi:hypothetical protein